MDLTQIVDSIYLVPLETNEECLIKKVCSMDYVDNKFYPYSKYVLGNLFVSYFQFEENLYVEYMNKLNGKSLILKNVIDSHHQFMLPHSIYEDKFLYASEVSYLPYLIDERLMSNTEISKIEGIEDMDNPVVIIYKMKNE